MYNVDMTFQTNLVQLILICKKALTFSKKKSKFLPPCAPKMTKIKPPLGPLIICFIDIGREMVVLHFLLFIVTVWQLCELHTS